MTVRTQNYFVDAVVVAGIPDLLACCDLLVEVEVPLVRWVIQMLGMSHCCMLILAWAPGECPARCSHCWLPH
jgi:hypothetical protein